MSDVHIATEWAYKQCKDVCTEDHWTTMETARKAALCMNTLAIYLNISDRWTIVRTIYSEPERTLIHVKLIGG